MEFSEKQCDGPYEVIGVEINYENQSFQGLLYCPPKKYKKPYPLIIYFHGFPQIIPLTDIVSKNKFLLEMGYAFLIANFRGYSSSEGMISIESQISDGLKLLEFAEKMILKNIFNPNNINIFAHDLGAYFSSFVCSKKKIVNKMLWLSPVLFVKELVEDNNFRKTLEYLKRYLPGIIHGIEDVNEFIRQTNEELSNFDIQEKIDQIYCQEIKIIIGDKDKLTPIDKINSLLERLENQKQVKVIQGMEHEIYDEDEQELVDNEIKKFFTD